MSQDLSMESMQVRLDELEKLVQDSEGDADRVDHYWGELRHLRQVYDRMIMDSQGKGIQMMQDIMERNPTTRENYVSGVPTASVDEVLDEPAENTEAPCVPAPAPANITINVSTPKEEAVETFDDHVVSLMRSDRFGSDIQIPADVQGTMEKAKKAKKHSDSVDGIDQEKINKMHAESDKEKDDDEDEDETPETKKSQQDSFYRSETETIQKALLYRDSSLLTSIGKWAHKAMKKSCMLDNLSKAIRVCFEKAAGDGEDVNSPGSSLLAGMKARAGAGGVAPMKDAYANIVSCNAKIQSLQEQMQDVTDPDKLVEIDKQLRNHYQRLAFYVMNSEGLGLKTEDMIQNEPDTRFPKEMTKPVVGAGKTQKSQSDDLEKGRRSGNRSGQIGKLKFVITYWDAEGGLSKEQSRAIVLKVASTDKSISRRLHAKIPALKKMRNMDHFISLGGDANAPIPSRGSKGSKARGRNSRDAKSGKTHSDRRIGSSNHPGRHGKVRHIVRGKK